MQRNDDSSISVISFVIKMKKQVGSIFCKSTEKENEFEPWGEPTRRKGLYQPKNVSKESLLDRTQCTNTTYKEHTQK